MTRQIIMSAVRYKEPLRIVGLIGVAGSGKSLAAARMVDTHGFTRMRFAGPIKCMLKAGFGLTDEQVDGELKSAPIHELGGATPRTLMQTLGTAWGRNMIHPDLWVYAWKVHVQRMTGLVVVDDVRFPNEADAIRSLGGTLWRVYRPGLVTQDHVSERSQQGIEEDILLNNALDIDAFNLSIDWAVAQLSRRAA